MEPTLLLPPELMVPDCNSRPLADETIYGAFMGGTAKRGSLNMHSYVYTLSGRVREYVPLQIPATLTVQQFLEIQA